MTYSWYRQASIGHTVHIPDQLPSYYYQHLERLEVAVYNNQCNSEKETEKYFHDVLSEHLNDPAGLIEEQNKYGVGK